MQVHDYYLKESRNMDPDDLAIFNVGFGESCSGYSYGYDCRDFYLMQYCLRGNGTLDLEGKSYEVSAGQGFLTVPGAHWRIFTNDSWSLCWIGFSGPHIESHLAKSGILNPDSPIFSFENEILLESSIENLYHKSRNPTVSNATLIGLFYTLLGNMEEENTMLLHSDTSSMALSYFEKADYYITKNILKKPTVEQLVLEFEISPSQLYRSFIKDCGLSPKQYIDKKKMEKACDLIRHTSLSCHQIAAMLGYEYDAAFFQAFKRQTGIRPSEYRERMTQETTSEC